MEGLMILLLILAMVITCIFVVIQANKQIKKDWDKLNVLKNRAKIVKTKDEISELYCDILIFALYINNRAIHYELAEIHYQLNHLYKTLN